MKIDVSQKLFPYLWKKMARLRVSMSRNSLNFFTEAHGDIDAVEYY